MDSITLMIALVIMFVGLPLVTQALHGRLLKRIALALLALETIAIPLAILLANVGIPVFYNDPSGFGSLAYIFIHLILLPIVWIEYLKTKKPGKTSADVERSYRLILILAVIFVLLPMTTAVLRTIW